MSRIKVSLAGGLGNQLFQYAFALAESSGEIVELEWVLGPAVQNHVGMPELCDFNLSNRILLRHAKKAPKFMTRLIRVLRQASSTQKKWVRSSIFWPVKKTINLLLNIYLDEKVDIFLAEGTGYFSKRPKKTKQYCVGFFHSFRWPAIPEVITELKQLKLKNPSTEIAVYQELALRELPLVVHIRLGDYENQDGFGIPSAKYYSDGISSQWLSGDYKKIWVFTNDMEKASHYLPSEYLPYVRWIPAISNSSSETLEVMRLGRGYVIGNSTFSWWGAFLSYSLNPKIVAPDPWFISANSPKDIIPTTWDTHYAWDN